MDFAVGRVPGIEFSTPYRYDLGEAMKKTVNDCFRPGEEIGAEDGTVRDPGDTVYPEYCPKIETLMSERNKPMILIEGYKYILRHTQRDGHQRWVCSDYGCRSFVKLDPSFMRIMDRRTQHEHEKPDPRKITRQKISYCLKQAAVYDLDSNATRLLANELLPSELSSLSQKDIGNIRKNISYARRKARKLQDDFKIPDFNFPVEPHFPQGTNFSNISRDPPDLLSREITYFNHP